MVRMELQIWTLNHKNRMYISGSYEILIDRKSSACCLLSNEYNKFMFQVEQVITSFNLFAVIIGEILKFW